MAEVETAGGRKLDPKTKLREKNKRAQKRFRERQKVRPTLGSDGLLAVGQVGCG